MPLRTRNQSLCNRGQKTLVTGWKCLPTTSRRTSGKSKARPDTADDSAKCSEHGASGKSEAIAEQQRVNHPRHWLEVPANNLAESELVSKRKALAKVAGGRKPSPLAASAC